MRTSMTSAEILETAMHLTHDAKQCDWFEGDGLYLSRQLEVQPIEKNWDLQQDVRWVLICDGKPLGEEYDWVAIEKKFIEVLTKWSQENFLIIE